jgi:RNA polymerase sigma-70 factor (ECF subfamily)
MKDAFTDGVKGSARQDHGLERLKSTCRTPGAPDRRRRVKLDSMEMRTEMQTETQTAMPLQRFDGAALQSDQWNVDLEAGPGGEARLLAAARNGNSVAFGELFNRYKRRIFHLAQRIMRNHEDAEDVVQEAFQLAFIHLQDFKGGARFSTWLSSIAINVALMKLRKKARKVEVSIDEHSESEDTSFRDAVTDLAPNPEQDCLRRERARILREALAELRPNARRVLELYELEGRSIKEIAQGLGISVPAVKARLFHARPKMRHELDQYFVKRAERQKRLRLGAARAWESNGRELRAALS